ncbi:uncharacterized protein LOC142168275 [Nicotiana tabacum]|uniref:Uncharacterized protein LOC142168275 n=1 Tax=Nicotiana tabacum TaxID=4097 RepID=A0AC58SJ95_TOBAC
MGILTGKSIELAKILQKSKINIACIRETGWVEAKARDADRFKLWYSRGPSKNEIGILVDRELREQVVEVIRVNDKVMIINDYDDVYDGFGFGDRNDGGTSLLEFAKAFDLVIAYSRKDDGGICIDYKAIPSENIATRHRLLLIDFEIKRERKKWIMYAQPKIKWGALIKDKSHELGEKLMAFGDWRSSRDASSMWARTADCIRKVAREVLGVSKGYPGKYKGDW